MKIEITAEDLKQFVFEQQRNKVSSLIQRHKFCYLLIHLDPNESRVNQNEKPKFISYQHKDLYKVISIYFTVKNAKKHERSKFQKYP